MRQVICIIVFIFLVPCLAHKSKTLDRYITECKLWIQHYNKILSRKNPKDDDILRGYVTFEECLYGISDITKFMFEKVGAKGWAPKHVNSVLEPLQQFPRTIMDIEKIKMGKSAKVLLKQVKQLGSMAGKAITAFIKESDAVKTDISDLSRFVGDKYIDFEEMKGIGMALQDTWPRTK